MLEGEVGEMLFLVGGSDKGKGGGAVARRVSFCFFQKVWCSRFGCGAVYNPNIFLQPE